MMSSPEIPKTILGAAFHIVHVDSKTFVRCTRCHRYLADVYVRPDGVFGSTCINKAGGMPTEVYTMVRSDKKPLETEALEYALQFKPTVIIGDEK